MRWKQNQANEISWKPNEEENKHQLNSGFNNVTLIFYRNNFSVVSKIKTLIEVSARENGIQNMQLMSRDDIFIESCYKSNLRNE